MKNRKLGKGLFVEAAFGESVAQFRVPDDPGEAVCSALRAAAARGPRVAYRAAYQGRKPRS